MSGLVNELTVLSIILEKASSQTSSFIPPKILPTAPANTHHPIKLNGPRKQPRAKPVIAPIIAPLLAPIERRCVQGRVVALVFVSSGSIFRANQMMNKLTNHPIRLASAEPISAHCANAAAGHNT